MYKCLLFSLYTLTFISYYSFAQLSAPQLYGPPDNAYVVKQPITLSWSNVPGATCYFVYVNIPEGPITADDTCTTSGTSITISGLDPGTTYVWSVTPYSPSHGWGPISVSKKFTTAEETAPETIENLIQGVIDLISDLKISSNQGNILINRLQQAKQHSQNNQKVPALANMLVFKVRIFILRASDQLAQADYANLNYSADGVIDLIADIEGSNPPDISNLLIPEKYSLSQNYPNPFNPVTTIEYSLPKNTWATIKVFDILGKEVATLVDETKDAGTYIVNWNASGFASGIYFYSLITPDFVETKKMILTK